MLDRTMHRVAIFLTLLLAARFVVAADPSPKHADRPNIVLMVIDDLGASDLGCYGSTYHRTPHLDALAKGGVRSTQAYAACPVCSPTRAALMTGKWPARLHLTDWLPGRPDNPAQMLARPAFNNHLPLDEVTLAELLRSAGYATASIGKWHLGGAGFEPTRQGFQLNIAGDDRGSPPGYFAPYVRNNPTLTGLEDAPAGEYLTDRLASEAEKFIAAHAREPFFLYVAHFGVHTPLQGKPELVEQFPKVDKLGAQANPIYAAMLQSVDDSVGRIQRQLASLGLSERTLFVFTSDNGGLATLEGPHTPATSNAPLREGKGYLYEGGIRVPLIAHWPKQLPAGSTSDAVVSSVDLLPTILAAAKVETPQDIDGENAWPSWQGQTPDEQFAARDAIYWHYPHYSNQGGKPGGAIRVGDWKLIEFYEDNRRELFNLKQDPRESRNRAADEPERVQQLATRLASWRKEVNAQNMTPFAGYKPNPPDKEGVITLHAKTARVSGVQLRYEPLPHKNTLGYWTNPADTAHWEFTVAEAGRFAVEALVGCGNGSGGSDVAFRFKQPQGDAPLSELKFTVEATGGFQQFVPRELGQLEFPTAGRYQLIVQPLKKPGVAVMDLRQVTLRPLSMSK